MYRQAAQAGYTDAQQLLRRWGDADEQIAAPRATQRTGVT